MISLKLCLIPISAMIGYALAKLWKGAIFSPDDFSHDAYGYITNQISHFVLGVAIVALAMFATWLSTGEFMDKWLCFICVLAGYGSFEWEQGGKITDMLQDASFVCLHGCGSTLLTFTWQKDLYVDFNFMCAIASFVSLAAHLGVGYVWRTKK